MFLSSRVEKQSVLVKGDVDASLPTAGTDSHLGTFLLVVGQLDEDR